MHHSSMETLPCISMIKKQKVVFDVLQNFVLPLIFLHVQLCSLPSEVCTVVSEADCITPVETICGAASPSPDCQMVLRQFFNDSGVFCVNVSLTNDVSLAVASARVSVTVGECMKDEQQLDSPALCFSCLVDEMFPLQALEAQQLEQQPQCWV